MEKLFSRKIQIVLFIIPTLVLLIFSPLGSIDNKVKVRYVTIEGEILDSTILYNNERYNLYGDLVKKFNFLTHLKVRISGAFVSKPGCDPYILVDQYKLVGKTDGIYGKIQRIGGKRYLVSEDQIIYELHGPNHDLTDSEVEGTKFLLGGLVEDTGRLKKKLQVWDVCPLINR